MEKKINTSNYSKIINRAGMTKSNTKTKIIPIKCNGNKQIIRQRVKGPEIIIHEVNHQNIDINPGPVLQGSSRNTSLSSASLQNSRNLATHSHLQNDGSLSLQSLNNPQPTVQNGPAIKNQHGDVTGQSRERGYLENLDSQQQHSSNHYPVSPNVIKPPRSNENPSDSPRSTSHQEVTKNIPRVLQQPLPNEENFPIITKLSTDSEGTAENILINELNDILNNINTTIAPLYDSMSTIRKAFYEYAQRFQRAVNDVDNYCELKLKDVTAVNKQQTEQTISEDTSTRDNDHRNRNYNNSDEHVKFTKQSCSFVLPPDYEPNREVFTKELSNEKLNFPNNDESSVGSECKPHHASTDEHPITTKMSFDSNGMIENIFINEFNNILNNIDITLARKHESMITIHKAIYDYTKTFEKVIADVNSYCKLNVKEVTRNRQQTESAISSLPEGAAARDKELQNRNKDNPNVEDVKPKKKPCLFVLPPDYERNDTRWTLRHRKPGPGLVELITKSNVYVNKNRLYHCCAVARNCNVLARMLLQIIFSSNALRVCSLTGARGYGHKLDDSDIRPGLDEHARIILLTFVKDHGVSQGWQVPDIQTIVNSIRYKLKEIRKKPF